jgi:hypothetical protein
MYEVKLHLNLGNVAHTFTIATFDGPSEAGPNYSRGKALAFAKSIDRGYGVTVQYVPDEEDREKNFGVIYERVSA